MLGLGEGICGAAEESDGHTACKDEFTGTQIKEAELDFKRKHRWRWTDLHSGRVSIFCFSVGFVSSVQSSFSAYNPSARVYNLYKTRLIVHYRYSCDVVYPSQP